MAKKIRIDELLVRRNLAEDITHAKALIMTGIVYKGEERVNSGAEKVSEETCIELRDKSQKFVSRGGLKLEKALNSFPIDLKGKVCADIGASTGGFTDCMLQNGAKKVFSIDVGYGQLAWKLRCDERVVNMERTNIKNVDSKLLGCMVDFASADVSFISLKHVFNAAKNFMQEGSHMVALIKPQFEADYEDVGEKGVVRDPHVHIKTIKNVLCYAEENNFSPIDITFSPIKGPEGNIEYLCFLKRDDFAKNYISEEKIIETVNEAHSSNLSRHNK